MNLYLGDLKCSPALFRVQYYGQLCKGVSIEGHRLF